MGRKYHKLNDAQLAGRLYQKAVAGDMAHPLDLSELVLVTTKQSYVPLYIGRIVSVLEAVVNPERLYELRRFAYEVERPDGIVERVEASCVTPASKVPWGNLEKNELRRATLQFRYGMQAERNASAFRAGGDFTNARRVGWLQNPETVLLRDSKGERLKPKGA